MLTEIVENAVYRIDENTRMVQKSLAHIDHEALWHVPNRAMNSIANLILHLCGNMGQYAIASLGNGSYQRQRDLEFSRRSGETKKELLQLLLDTVEKTKAAIQESTVAELLKKRKVQGYRFSGLGIVFHVVEHYSYHTGQIAYLVKQMKHIDLGFYDGIDLNEQ